MYGLLLESFSNFIKLNWGEESWEAVRRHAGNESPTFCIHQIYAETLIPKLARSAVQVLGIQERELFEAMGEYFVDFVGQFGYDQVMSVLGRHMRDFLNGLDNLHEYLKFSYPRMRAPSFFCENETVDGMILHYRSKRRGFVYYTMGQIKQVAKRFYDTDCHIELLSEELDGCAVHVTFELKFDNRAFIRDKTESLMTLYREEQLLPFRTSKLFELFPFCIVFGQDMLIRQTGYSLMMILKDLVGLALTEAFDIVRPIIPINFSSILERQNNSFELVTLAPINTDDTVAMVGEDSGQCLRLRGQMLYMDDWKSIMFLATPVMPDLDSLLAAGLFINDLSLHDCSRDFVLAGTQQSVELRLALHQEQLKTRKLEDSMRKLDAEMKRTDELLYQMIPKQVADRIRLGENPVDTCEVFDAVSILFSDVVTFTEICSRITPMLVVSMLNHMYSLFDQLTERNGVYKVETIGDSYMVVSGAPSKEINHADRICDMALDMIEASMGIFDPSREGEHLKIRVGIHSGTVVAGVVGLKMPRYCLFGDTVNTSSRMESTSESGKIQISETTKKLLPPQYVTEYRGEVQMKGKGKMNTYWLISRSGRIPLDQLERSVITWTAPAVGIYSSTNTPEDHCYSSSFPRERTTSSPRPRTNNLEMAYREHRNSWGGGKRNPFEIGQAAGRRCFTSTVQSIKDRYKSPSEKQKSEEPSQGSGGDIVEIFTSSGSSTPSRTSLYSTMRIKAPQVEDLTATEKSTLGLGLGNQSGCSRATEVQTIMPRFRNLSLVEIPTTVELGSARVGRKLDEPSFSTSTTVLPYSDIAHDCYTANKDLQTEPVPFTQSLLRKQETQYSESLKVGDSFNTPSNSTYIRNEFEQSISKLPVDLHATRVLAKVTRTPTRKTNHKVVTSQTCSLL